MSKTFEHLDAITHARLRRHQQQVEAVSDVTEQRTTDYRRRTEREGGFNGPEWAKAQKQPQATRIGRLLDSALANAFCYLLLLAVALGFAWEVWRGFGGQP